MYRFFETIAIQDGKILNPEGHQKRYLYTLQSFYGNRFSIFDINTIPILHCYSSGLIRCRMSYNAKRQHIQLSPYRKREIKTFYPVIDDHISYEFKVSQRKKLEKLFARRQNCDEIMIIKKGFVTDCSIGNLIFLKQGEWFTPTTYLLNGTQRQLLLAEKKIQLREIMLKDIDQFEEIRMINALNGLEN